MRKPGAGQDKVQDAVALAAEVGHVFVATASSDGLPHLAAAGSMSLDDAGLVRVSEWFCPGTMANLAENRRVALVAWDRESDRGYQLLGRVAEVEELAVVDGYAGRAADEIPPQVERELVIDVERVLDFSQGPHSDRPEFK